MAKIAVIKTGGKQYKVKEGDTVKVEKLNHDKKTINFDTLLTSQEDGKEFNLGAPSLSEKVKGEIVEEGKNKKVNVVKYKNKIRYKRSLGHKQPYSKVKISKIV